MSTIRNRFYPLHDYNEHNVISLYSLDVQSGLAGTLVKIIPASANPQNADGWAVGTSVGVQISNFQAISQRYETKMKVTATASGDTAFNALGLTLLNTLEFDENSQPLRYNERRAKEIGAVISGETVPIVTKGLFGFWGQYIDQSLSAAQPGNVVCVSRSGQGLLAAVDPTNAAIFSSASTGGAALYSPNQIVGKFLTAIPSAANTGQAAEFSTLGGYVLIAFDASV